MKEKLFSLIYADPLRLSVLKAVRGLALPDCWVGAGFIRAMVWDYISGYKEPTNIDDVDVIYFDPSDTREETEKLYDQRLKEDMPDIPWSCKNQARMYLKFGAGNPYKSAEDGLRHWLETATAVAVRVDEADELHLLAPFGLEDLFDMRIVPTPYALQRKPDQYRTRVLAKPWCQQWPNIRVVMP